MSRPHLGDVVAAELVKLRTLPAVPSSVLSTVLVGALVAAATAGAAGTGREAVTAVEAVTATVPLLQAGLVLVGVWPVAHEQVGHQITLTLRAVPHRPTAVAGTTVAATVLVVLTAVLSVGAALLGALAVRARTGAGPVGTVEGRTLLGAVAALTLAGLLGHAIALLVRHLVPALVGGLALVLLLPPVLAGATGLARWLPGRAAAQLYDRTDTVLGPVTGGLVALAWVVLIGGTGAVLVVRRDA